MASAIDNQSPIRVVHILPPLERGGIQTRILQIIKSYPAFPPTEHVVIALKEKNSMTGEYRENPLLPDFEAAGAKVILLDHNQALSRNSLQYQTLEQVRPHIVHAAAGKSPHFLFKNQELFGNAKIVAGAYTPFHMPDSYREMLSTDERLEKYNERDLPETLGYLQQADTILCNSAAVYEALKKEGIAPDKLSVINNGIDGDYFKPSEELRKTTRQTLGIKENDTVIGVAARFAREKDLPTFLEAAKLYLGSLSAEEKEKTKFLIAGLYTDGPELKALIDEKGLTGQVITAGARDDMPAIYNAMDIHTSSSKSEPFGKIVAESLACGVPNVTTDTGIMRELVGENSGVICGVGDAEGMANGWKTLLNLPDKDFNQTKERARAHILKHFSEQEMITRFAEALTRLVRNPKHKVGSITLADARPQVSQNNTQVLNADPKKVLIWVESQFGSGHMNIAARLSRALSSKGIEVTIASSRVNETSFDFGGARREKLPGYLHVNTTLTENHIENYQDREWIKQRGDRLVELYKKEKYGAIITESWPFSLSPLHDEELERLAKEAKDNGTQIYSLTRDILSVKPPQTEEQKSRRGIWGGTVERFKKKLEEYDINVIVRGDGRLHRLDESRPGFGDFNQRTFYPGYFTKPQPYAVDKSYSPDKEVVVSSGGSGSFCKDAEDFFAFAMKSRKYSRQLCNNPWRLFIPLDPDDPRYVRLLNMAQRESPEGKIIVQPNDPTFSERKEQAALCIIRGGHTAIEAVASLTPFVIAPNGTHDQMTRARKFSELGLTAAVYTPSLARNLQHTKPESPEDWARAIDRVYSNRHAVERYNIGTLGAFHTVRDIIIPRLSRLEKRSSRLLGHSDREMKNKPLHAVILDWDGVIVRPGKNDEIAWNYAMEKMQTQGHAKQKPWTRKDKTVNAPYDPLDFFTELYGSPELGKKALGYVTDKLEELIPDMTIVPDARETLRHLYKSGVPVIIASNSPADYVRKQFEYHFKQDCPQAEIVGSDDETSPKPSPVMLYQGLDRLGISESGKVLFFGDGYKTDIQAARIAGVKPVLIKTGKHVEVPPDEQKTLEVVDGHEHLRHYVNSYLGRERGRLDGHACL